MKVEETTEFLIEWGDDNRLSLHEGLAMASTVLDAGPLPVQVSTRSTTYMALGADVPAPWMRLFEHAHDPGAMQVEQSFVSRAEHGFITQVLSLSPCEQGEHLHATLTLTYLLLIEEGAAKAAVKARLVEAWRDVGDRMTELQDQWVVPFLDSALELESLHGGQG